MWSNEEMNTSLHKAVALNLIILNVPVVLRRKWTGAMVGSVLDFESAENTFVVLAPTFKLSS